MIFFIFCITFAHLKVLSGHFHHFPKSTDMHVRLTGLTADRQSGSSFNKAADNSTNFCVFRGKFRESAVSIIVLKRQFILLVFKHKDTGSYFVFFIELALARSLQTCSLFPPNLYCAKNKSK